VWYVLKDEILRGVSISANYTLEQSAERQQFERDIGEYFEANCAPIGVNQILRANGIKAFIVSAIHWRTKIQSLDCYLVSTSHEISFVIADQKFLASDDFFLPPSEKERIDQNGPQLLMKLPDEVRAKVLAEARPIMDVAPKFRSESKSSRNQYGRNSIFSPRPAPAMDLEVAAGDQVKSKPKLSLGWFAIGTSAIGLLWLLLKKHKKRPGING
jgi:hypothetical protein